MANPAVVTLHVSAAETASGTAAVQDITALRQCADLTLDVTAISGTGAALTATIETSDTGSGWRAANSFRAMTATGSQSALVGNLGRYVRASWTLTGTGSLSATFAVNGTAHVIYASLKDFATLAIAPEAFSGIGEEERVRQLLAASDMADGYLAGAYDLPLSAWGLDLRKQVAKLAALELLNFRGRNTVGPDDALDLMEQRTLAWFKGVAGGTIHPQNIVDTTPTVNETSAQVVSQGFRGWGR